MWTTLFILALLALLFSVWIVANASARDAEGLVQPGLRAIEFPERTLIIAEGSSVYRPLPAAVIDSPLGEVVTCWYLTPRQRIRLLFTGKLWAAQMTFGACLQPILFSTEKTDVLKPAEPAGEGSDKA